MNISYALDDLIGATLTLYLLPFAGAESAIALALLVAFYPSRLNLSIDVATLPPILMISPMEQFELYTVSFFTSAIFFMISLITQKDEFGLGFTCSIYQSFYSYGLYFLWPA